MAVDRSSSMFFYGGIFLLLFFVRFRQNVTKKYEYRTVPDTTDYFVSQSVAYLTVRGIQHFNSFKKDHGYFFFVLNPSYIGAPS